MVKKSKLDEVMDSLDDVQSFNQPSIVGDPSEPSKEALDVAKRLLGTATQFSDEDASVLGSLTRFGIAVCVGEEGWVRGYRWREYCHKK